MRPRIILLFVMLGVCFLSSQQIINAQVINEADSRMLLQETSAELSLPINNPGAGFEEKLELELLDINGKVRAQASPVLQIKTGNGSYPVTLQLGDLLKTDGDISWYRLRYRLGRSTGIVSLLHILRENFDLRIIASESVLPGMSYRIRVLATDPVTGKAVPGVKFDAELSLDLKGDDDKKLKLATRGETGPDGFAMTDVEIPLDAELDDEGKIRIIGRKNGIVHEAEEELQTAGNDTRFLIMTDKSIYQPEQNLNVRGILIKGGANAKKTLSGVEMEFRIMDEDDTVLYREKVITSDFGVAFISWKIPENAKLGNYSITIKNSDDGSLGYQSIKVSRYDLPNFAVQAKPDKPYYLPRDNRAEITVSADYLFGKPVTKGKVRVVRENSRQWNWKEQKYDIEEGDTRQGETNADGKFIAKFDLSEDIKDLKDEDWDTFDDLHFTAYFTDLTTNRTEHRQFDVRVTKEAIHVYYIGEKNNNNSYFPVEGFVSTFYADGSPAACSVEVKGSEDEQEKFQTLQRLKTNSYGAGRITFKHPAPEDYDYIDIQIIARDDKGNKGIYSEEFEFDEDGPVLRMDTGKTIFKPGEAMNVKLESSNKSALVYIDVVDGWTVIDSYTRVLENGRAELTIPYRPEYKGQIKIASYFEDAENDDEVVRTSRGVIFPAPQDLRLAANFSKESYKPGEEATLSFGVWDTFGRTAGAALGVVILDRAIEERARTENAGGSILGDFYGWTGYGANFGGISLKSLIDLDLTKPVPDELELVGAVMMYNNYYTPNIFHNYGYDKSALYVYQSFFRSQSARLETIFNQYYSASGWNEHPVDDASLKKVLSAGGINFDDLRDPWDQNYRAKYGIDKAYDTLRFISAGADKTFDTDDDVTISSHSFNYFTLTGKKIDDSLKAYHARTGDYIFDEKAFYGKLDLASLKDRFGRQYRLIFDVSGRYYTIRFRSAGEDGVFANDNWHDDFDVWTSQVDYFTDTEIKIKDALASAAAFPSSESELRSLLRSQNLDLDRIRDGYGRRIYATRQQFSRFTDKIAVENYQSFGSEKPSQRTVVTPVTQEVRQFTLRSRGKDGRENTPDDFTLAQFLQVISEKTKDGKISDPKMQKIVFIYGSGSIRGTVIDPNGATIPGTTVTATNDASQQNWTATTNSNGEYLITNLPPGNYSIRASAVGFKDTVTTAVPVSGDNITRLDISLSVGTVAETVTVTAAASEINQTNNTVGTSISSRQLTDLPLNGRSIDRLALLNPGIVNIVTRSGSDDDDRAGELRSTPKVREYFPETLLWSPDVVTNSEGKAELKFKLADNITTWKMYTVASNKEGKIGIAEKEIQAFQPFFVDLEPPKFLTEGDEIFLPVTIRNYTAAKQNVKVTMAGSEWFSFLNQPEQQIDVAAGNSGNAVFGFKATSQIKDGKQRVTALAQTDSDAIEKPVTVRPNGREMVKTESKFFGGNASFDVNFPANAMPRTQKAELKIYPNLLTHVSESVEGLLQRPYGCGEQTISSTYPNLMVLKFTGGDTKLRRTAGVYLQKGYERLLGYQIADGGFSYWGGKDTADIALTAYALRFLSDASSYIQVDAEVIKKAQDWLGKQQRSDGSWTKSYFSDDPAGQAQTKLLTSYVARSMAISKEKDVASLQKALAYLKARNLEIDEPYALALLGLAAADTGAAGDLELARSIAARLEKMMIAEGDGAYWKLETNTPFYGWGTAGRIETTALVTQLFIKLKTAERPHKELLSRAMVFLLKNKDRYGVWYSTQTTINVLDTFLAALKAENSSAQQQNIRVMLNGAELQSISVPPDQIEPVIVKLDEKISAANNRLEIASSGTLPLMSQIVSIHYIDWKDTEASATNTTASRTLRFSYSCGKQSAAIMQEIICNAEVERVGFAGYGMLLAEIGIPPGADVNRESLKKAMEADWSFSRYDILPDRIVVYMWAKAGGTKINFSFRPRYGINAQTPASAAYDYYNPEARAEVAPLAFAVR